MLRVIFNAGPDSPRTVLAATFLRFCADGSVRGPDNCVVARCVDGLWRIREREHRELGCEGAAIVRITLRPGEPPTLHGPFQQLRTVAGVLHDAGTCLGVCLPGRTNVLAVGCHEITLLSSQETKDE